MSVVVTVIAAWVLLALAVAVLLGAALRLREHAVRRGPARRPAPVRVTTSGRGSRSHAA